MANVTLGINLANNVFAIFAVRMPNQSAAQGEVGQMLGARRLPRPRRLNPNAVLISNNSIDNLRQFTASILPGHFDQAVTFDLCPLAFAAELQVALLA